MHSSAPQLVLHALSISSSFIGHVMQLLEEYRKTKIEIGAPMGRDFDGDLSAFGRMGGIYQRRVEINTLRKCKLVRQKDY
jgi:hypothetical protein